VNREYFGGAIQTGADVSARKTFRILGTTMPPTRRSPSAGRWTRGRCQKYVVDYVVYHEMLHIHHPTKHVNGRRYNHTPAFRRDEESLPTTTKRTLDRAKCPASKKRSQKNARSVIFVMDLRVSHAFLNWDSVWDRLTHCKICHLTTFCPHFTKKVTRIVFFGKKPLTHCKHRCSVIFPLSHRSVIIQLVGISRKK